MIPSGSSFQNQTSSGANSSDVFESMFSAFGNTTVYNGEAGQSGMTVSTPVLVAGLVLAGIVAWKVLK